MGADWQGNLPEGTRAGRCGTTGSAPSRGVGVVSSGLREKGHQGVWLPGGLGRGHVGWDVGGKPRGLLWGQGQGSALRPGAGGEAIPVPYPGHPARGASRLG